MSSNFFLQNYVADIAVTALFGLGYYLFNSKKQRKLEDKESSKVDSIDIKLSKCSTLEEYSALIALEGNLLKNPYILLNSMYKKGISPTIDTYNYLLYNCLKYDQVEEFFQLKDEVFDPTGPVIPNSYTLCSLIKGTSEKYLKISNSLEGNSIEEERLLVHSKFDNELKDYILDLSNRSVPITIQVHNTIIDTLIEHKRINEAFLNYENMKTGFKPNLYTYSLLLKGIKNIFSKQNITGDNENKEEVKFWVDKGFELINAAEADVEVTLDENLYNRMLDICVNLNLISEAEELFEKIKRKFEVENSDKVNEFAYSIMIKGYMKLKSIEKCYSIFDDLKLKLKYYKKRTAYPNSVSYSCMLNACVKLSKIDLAEYLLEEMTNFGIEKNLYIYTTMINGYKDVKNHQKAFELYDCIVKDNKFELNTIFFNSILDCCVETKKIDKMNEILNYMKSDEHMESEPEIITYSILIKGYAKASNL